MRIIHAHANDAKIVFVQSVNLFVILSLSHLFERSGYLHTIYYYDGTRKMALGVLLEADARKSIVALGCALACYGMGRINAR